MDRRHVQAFLAVLDHGGFSAAADELGIAQPTVSQAVGALERELGFPLIVRLHRGVRPTSAGEQLAEPARVLMRDFATLESVADEIRGIRSGSLDLMAIPTLTHELAELVGRFHSSHPEVTVRCGDPGLMAIEEHVRAGECELGLGEVPAAGHGIVTVPVGSQPFLLVQPPGSAVLGSMSREHMAALDFVATPRGTSSRTLLDDALGGTPARVVVETAQREALVPLVIAGAGSALLPQSLARQAAAQGALIVTPVPRITRRLALLHRPGPLSPAALAFLALVAVADGVSRPSGQQAPA